MINIAELVKRHQLASLQDRIKENDDALDLIRGLYTPPEGELLPITINTQRRRALDRALRQMQTLGPRVLETKTNAIIGNVTWSTENDLTDEILNNVDLRALASNLLASYVATGVAAGYVYTDDRGIPRITRLGGYVEPYTDPDDVDRILGLYQAWQVVRENRRPGSSVNAFGDNQTARYVGKWIVRVYDWTDSADGECVMQQWNDLSLPYQLAGNPDEVEERLPRPRFAVRSVSQEGLPVGEVVASMPQLKALWATEARMALSEELAAFPMLLALGDVDDDITVGASEVITGGDGARVEWMQPGNLQELRDQRALRMERITSDLMLPVSFSTTQAASAESMRERNIQFRQNTDGYARDISRLITNLVGTDFVLASGGEPAEIAIMPTLAYDEPARVQSIISLFREGLIPLPVAASAIQPFFPTWTDEDLNDWVEQQTAVVSVADFGA